MRETVDRQVNVPLARNNDLPYHAALQRADYPHGLNRRSSAATIQRRAMVRNREAQRFMLGAGSDAAVSTLMLWGSIALLGIVAFAVIVLLLRRRLYSKHDASAAPAYWDLQTLREMHERGDLTDEEYRVLKRQTIDSLSGDRGHPR